MRTSPAGRSLGGHYLVVAGALLFAAGVIAFMGIITAEALYPPGYSTSLNAISDLGATVPPNSVITQPSATIFNVTMMVCGLLALAASYCLQRGFRRWVAPVLIALFGLGGLGVGVFPADWGLVHLLFALLIFVAGGIAALVSWTIERGPFRYFSVLLGLVSLVTLVVTPIVYWASGDSASFGGLGLGGVERWIAYPVLLWAIGLGGHLMARGAQD